MRGFVKDPAHYNICDEKSPHDSWLDALNVHEVDQGEWKGIRNTTISADFIAAYGGELFSIKYRDVQSYEFSFDENDVPSSGGRGDWIIDEIVLLPSGFVSHEIEFSNGGVWKVVFADLEYSWPKPGSLTA